MMRRYWFNSQLNPKVQGDVGEHSGGLLWDLMFAKDGIDMTYYQIKCLYGELDSDTGDVELQVANLYLLKSVGVITLEDIGEGTLFTLISTSPYMVGEGGNMGDILPRVVLARKDRQELYKEENTILPKRFLPQFHRDRLPAIVRYSGKRHTKCGAKMYHDVQLMRPKDKRP